ncbi:MAG: hypothetical protein ACI8RZ_002121 [Myxococcota bacterium]|jgi:hypothetical protein
MFLLTMLPSAFAAPTAFMGVEWRGYTMADHLSHGPAFTLGASLLEDHLRLGFAATTRPGPINPATFPLDVSESPYNGLDTLQLRSDGGTAGLLIAPGTSIGRFHLSAPLMLGYGGYGFYLVGEDRVTPDGQKPSVWEDTLLAGKDSAFGLIFDGGLRIALHTDTPIRPTLFAGYHTILGYDGGYTDRYAGATIGLGVEVVPH